MSPIELEERQFEQRARIEMIERVVVPLGSVALDEQTKYKQDHNYAADSFRLYLNDVRRTDILTPAEATNLSKEIMQAKDAEAWLTEALDPSPDECLEIEALKAAGRKAVNSLAEGNLPLVISIAKRHIGRGMEMLDLVQYGNIGLIGAAKNFDWRKGFEFSTYATWCIRGEIKKALGTKVSPIKMVGQHAVKVAQIKRQVAMGVPMAEISKELGIKEDLAMDLLVAGASTESLDQFQEAVDEGAVKLASRLIDVNAVTDEDALRGAEFEEANEMLKGLLDERSYTVYFLRNTTDITLEELTLEFVRLGFSKNKLSRERIRQIEAKATEKVQNFISMRSLTRDSS